MTSNIKRNVKRGAIGFALAFVALGLIGQWLDAHPELWPSLPPPYVVKAGFELCASTEPWERMEYSRLPDDAAYARFVRGNPECRRYSEDRPINVPYQSAKVGALDLRCVALVDENGACRWTMREAIIRNRLN